MPSGAVRLLLEDVQGRGASELQARVPGLGLGLGLGQGIEGGGPGVELQLAAVRRSGGRQGEGGGEKEGEGAEGKR